jgi:hypothetical protein
MKNKSLLLLVLIPLVAFAGALKVWIAGDNLNVNDLNANFAHIHQTMVGGHGARLVNADVSSTAGISHSKLERPQLIPKMWVLVHGAGVYSACGASPCNFGIYGGAIFPSSITRSGAGVYTVNIPARPNNVYAVTVSPSSGAAQCFANTHNTASFIVNCATAAGAAADASFSVVMFDDNN